MVRWGYNFNLTTLVVVDEHVRLQQHTANNMQQLGGKLESLK